MFKKLHDHLLTHYPLLWNTKIVWVIATAFLIHLFFFLAGFVNIDAFSLQQYYSLDNVIDGSLMTFSILCSLAMLILWLVFYLRNNAYKSFYIIDKYHSAKEFFIILLIVFVSITFFESYRWGAWLKGRTITSKEQLVQEANTINLARAFIPEIKADYFKLNRCDTSNLVNYNDGTNYFDSTLSTYSTENSAIIRHVLSGKDAFSYKNYCAEFINLKEYKGFVPAKQWQEKRDRWIDHHDIDSIRQIVEECIAVCKKYDISQRINAREMADLVFVDSFHNVTRFFGRTYSNDYSQPDYFSDYSLENALSFIDNCRLNSKRNDYRMETLTVELYVALCFSILLFCYRLYSKRVFLISLVGSIVWCIVFALVAVSAVDSIAWFYLFLFVLFTLIGIISVESEGSKTVTGVLLNWHSYMYPFVLMIIILMIQDDYQKHDLYSYNQPIPDALLAKRYPIGYWVNNNTALLIRLNLLFVILYTAFFFSRLSKKWHIIPEE